MNENYYLAYLNDYATTDENHPIVYTRDLYSCIAVFMHEKSKTTLFHIESYKDGEIKIDILNDYLKNTDGKEINASIFKARNSSDTNINIIITLIEKNNISYTINDAYVSLSNETTIGYNANDDVYYGITMDNGVPIFDEIKITTDKHL